MSRRYFPGQAPGRADSGDTLAGLAFRQFHTGLFRYLLRKLRNAQSAEDLAQEVYLRLLRAADRREIQNPQAYIFGVAFNVLHEFRLNNERLPLEIDSQALARLEEVVADDAEGPDALQERQGRTRQLDAVMGSLSPMQRAVLLMAKRQGLAHAEIAAKLGISIGTVRKHLARAVSQCRKVLGE